ncbi:hypothetical protein JCM19239_5809 [Vibrio variabilis]|uniref:Uncharacterized protein n=1 Tax=Vibrio variabilis TaxID=990271 RepID=A0ABQ0J8D4_9VIBR|nr:hypothetical protein JCM19239_5809 [Vibrio variabilis]
MIPGMPSFGDIAGGLGNGGPSSAGSSADMGSLGGANVGGIGNRVDNSGIAMAIMVGVVLIGGILLWKLK